MSATKPQSESVVKQPESVLSINAEDGARHAGATLLLVFAGAALWNMAPLQTYGAAIVVGLLAAAFPRNASMLVSATTSGIAFLLCALLARFAPAPAVAAQATQLVFGLCLAVTLAVLVTALRSSGVTRKHLSWFALGVVTLLFVTQGLAFAREAGPQVDVEPPAEAYAFDPILFVKTFYLMEGGAGFYESYAKAFEQDSRFDAVTKDLAGWRSPTTYWLWSLVANKWSTIIYWFVVLAAASMSGAYFIAYKTFRDPVAAVLPAVLLVPYYYYSLPSWWYPELEFWATFVAIAAAVAIYLEREWLAIGLALLAGAMREWLLSVLVAGSAHRLFSKKRWRSLYWIGCAAIVVGGYLLNSYLVRKYLLSIGIEPQVGTTGRLGGGGPGFILYTARFCGSLMAHPYAVPWTALVIGVVIAVILVVRKRNLFLPALLLVPLAAFMVFGSGSGPFSEIGWNDYYGATYLPFAFILLAGLADPFELWRRRTQEELVASAPKAGSKAAEGSGHTKSQSKSNSKSQSNSKSKSNPNPKSKRRS